MAVSTSGAVRKKNGTFEGTGQGGIRTSEGVKRADLQSAPFGHSGTYPFASVDIGSRRKHRKCAQHWHANANALLAVKFRDFVHHKSLCFATQFWINWQSQCFRGRAFCFGKVALLMFQIEKTFLQMERNRVVNLASNFVAGEMRLQLVPRYGANDKLVIDVMIISALPIWLGWKNGGISQIAPGKLTAVKISGCATSCRPIGQMRQFYLKNRRLHFVQAQIPGNKPMMIARFHALFAASP